MLLKIKLINQISSDIIIEDIGVKLSGKGDSRIVDFDIASKSKDLVRMAGIVRQEQIPVLKIWPFTSTPDIPVPKSIIPPQKPNPVKIIIHDDQSKAISELSSKMDMILQMLSEKSNTPTTIVNQIMPSSGQIAQSPMKKSDDPVFIPSKIVPDGVESNMNIKSNEIQKEDIEDVSRKLGSLLRSKK